MTSYFATQYCYLYIARQLVFSSGVASSVFWAPFPPPRKGFGNLPRFQVWRAGWGRIDVNCSSEMVPSRPGGEMSVCRVSTAARSEEPV